LLAGDVAPLARAPVAAPDAAPTPGVAPRVGLPIWGPSGVAGVKNKAELVDLAREGVLSVV